MLYAPLTSLMRATCPAHLILLALITLTILGEENKGDFTTLSNIHTKTHTHTHTSTHPHPHKHVYAGKEGDTK
jgi:hypothetical protein